MPFDVVIPAYNSDSTLAGAIRSAWESCASSVIVVDDGSTDTTVSVAEREGALVLQQENSGASVARQRGAQSVTAEFFVFLDADDELVRGGVEKSIQLMASHPDLAVAAGRVRAIDNRGATKDVVPGFKRYSTSDLIQNGYSPWPPAAAVFSSRLYRLQEALELPKLHTRYAEDYELLIRSSIVGRIASHDLVSCIYRIEGGKSHKAAQEVVRCKEEIRDHYSSALGLSYQALTAREQRAAAEARIAHGAVASKMYATAAKHVVNALWLDPKIGVRALRRRLSYRRSTSA